MRHVTPTQLGEEAYEASRRAKNPDAAPRLGSLTALIDALPDGACLVVEDHAAALAVLQLLESIGRPRAFHIMRAELGYAALEILPRPIGTDTVGIVRGAEGAIPRGDYNFLPSLEKLFAKVLRA